jgi:hypothetical protein
MKHSSRDRRGGRQVRHTRKARAYKAGFATKRAFFEARLLRGDAVLPVTNTEMAELLGGSRNDIAAAGVVLASGDTTLITKVHRGEIPLRAAAKEVGPQVRLIQAFERAGPEARQALVRAVGPDAMFDLTTSVLEPAHPAEVPDPDSLFEFDGIASIERMVEQLFGQPMVDGEDAISHAAE